MPALTPGASSDSRSDECESGTSRVSEHSALRSEVAAATRQLLDALPNPVWFYDRNLVLCFANVVVRRLLGRSTREITGRHDEDLFVNATTDAYLPTLQFAAASKKRTVSGHLTLQARTVGAKPLACVITFTPVLDESNQLEYLVASANEQLPFATLESDANADAVGPSNPLALAVAGFAHDINNLLMVMGNYQSFVAAGSLSPQQSSDLKIAASATRSGVALAAHLLLLSKGQKASSAIVDANEIVASTARMLRPILGDAIQLSAVLSDVPLLVRAGTGELEQILINLAFNARDAMHHGPLGMRAFSATVVDGEPLASELWPGRYAVISVKDAGPGIDDETLSRIFQPFFTTKAQYGGTGLGLFMVRDVVRRLGGAVRIETAPGRGCEFFVYLPSLPAPPSTPSDESPVSGTSLRPLRELGRTPRS